MVDKPNFFDYCPQVCLAFLFQLFEVAHTLYLFRKSSVSMIAADAWSSANDHTGCYQVNKSLRANFGDVVIPAMRAIFEK